MLTMRMGMVVASVLVSSMWGVTWYSQSVDTESPSAMTFETVVVGDQAENKWLASAKKANLFDPDRKVMAGSDMSANASVGNSSGNSNDDGTPNSAKTGQASDAKSTDWRLVAITEDVGQRALIELPDTSFVSLNVGDITPDGRKISRIGTRQIWLTAEDSKEQQTVNLFTFE
ncbi:hypothetical protein BIZ37_06045 [Photobacterium sp. BZF1]|uniref:hypothetical protein n=1 Tax=Photobacterium sp. BZF1 TaxID=1904457 RepID=UPI0016537CD2|nr:hypothetical protein [Photobacterium sp. BZF1]MBC7002109.1 hypothetical protein [Photobacterium sp. BZF1]